jgi:redox-sensitive bicupin YhaK (pirin superfamily)
MRTPSSFSPGQWWSVRVRADTDAYLIYGHAPLINEPVAARGPFVMTTDAEVQQAAREYQAGQYA